MKETVSADSHVFDYACSICAKLKLSHKKIKYKLFIILNNVNIFWNKKCLYCLSIHLMYLINYFNDGFPRQFNTISPRFPLVEHHVDIRKIHIFQATMIQGPPSICE